MRSSPPSDSDLLASRFESLIVPCHTRSHLPSVSVTWGREDNKGKGRQHRRTPLGEHVLVIGSRIPFTPTSPLYSRCSRGRPYPLYRLCVRPTVLRLVEEGRWWMLVERTLSSGPIKGRPHLLRLSSLLSFITLFIRYSQTSWHLPRGEGFGFPRTFRVRSERWQRVISVCDLGYGNSQGCVIFYSSGSFCRFGTRSPSFSLPFLSYS